MSENKLRQLLKDLRIASDECWETKIAQYDISKKHANLCLQILLELGYVPKLVNGRIEKRKFETNGLEPFNKDFWGVDTIIALNEFMIEEFRGLDENERRENATS